jgi:uncharacterized protein YbjT (DUF2867 family)
MILIAGGTGTLGMQVVRLLTERGLEVRILTRDPSRVLRLGGHAALVAGDVRDAAAVRRAMMGADTVISAIQGFAGPGGVTPESVDHQGNGNLIRAARELGVGQFVLLSIHGAAPDHPMELFRKKALAEEELRASGMPWTIVRPTAYMETWLRLLGAPLLHTGSTRIFGRGRNPINFVSALDVAQVVALAATDPALRNTVIEVGGPENLTMRQVVETVERETGKSGKVRSVPLPVMRLMATLMRPVKPALARQIRAGVVMDTADMTFDASERAERFPSIPLTTLTEVVRREYGASR